MVEWAALTKRVATRAVAAAIRLGQEVPPELAEAASLSESELIERRLAGLRGVSTTGAPSVSEGSYMSDSGVRDSATLGWSPVSVSVAGPSRLRRVAMIAVYPSPLGRPGSVDTMGAYVMETAHELARRGVEVEIFTRAASLTDVPEVRVAPGVLVRNIVAGPLDDLDENDLVVHLSALTAGVLRVEANHEPEYYDVVHTHSWLAGQVGWLVADRFEVPLIHSVHSLAVPPELARTNRDISGLRLRAVAEQQVADVADRLIVNTEGEARQLIALHHVNPDKIDVISPGVGHAEFTPAPVEQEAQMSWRGAVDRLLASYERALSNYPDSNKSARRRLARARRRYKSSAVVPGPAQPVGYQPGR